MEKKTVKKKRLKEQYKNALGGDDTKLDEKPEDHSSKSVKVTENRQLLMILLVLGVFFAAFLIPYFYFQSLDQFEYAGTEWNIEEYETFTAYHTRFPRFDNSGGHHNIWLRNDPRGIDVPSEGDFNYFKYGGIISFDKFAGECIGELSRISLDLTDFLAQGIGAGDVSIGTIDKFKSVEEDVRYTTCQTVLDRTLIILQEGDRGIYQDEKNKYCYTINVETCDDILGVEAFMVKTLEDTLQTSPEADI